MSNNGVIKGRKVYFAQVSNEALRDNKLSLKAKGLYALIQSYITIENFTLYKNTLKKQCQEKEKSFESAWKELKDKGYLIQYKLQDGKGNFFYEYELLDIKKSVEPLIDKNFNHTPKKVGMGEKTTPPKKQVVDNAPSGKSGVYNNTNSNNTDLNNTYIEEEETTDKIYNLYTEVKGTISYYDRKNLSDLIKTYGNDITLKAVEVMAERADKPNIKYIKSTLTDWYSKGLQTIDLVEKHLAEREIQKAKVKQNRENAIKRAADNKPYIKKDGFTDYPQREYDFDDLEKKLLGWDKQEVEG